MSNTTPATESTTVENVATEAPVKRGPGRPRKYFTPEDIKEARKTAQANYQAGRAEKIAEAFDSLNVGRLSKANQETIAFLRGYVK